MRRVLVTGASGFIGRHVVRALLDASWDVVALVRDRSVPAEIQGARTERGDVTDTASYRSLLKDCGAVCHLAAYVPAAAGPDTLEECMRVNAAATGRLAFEAAAVPGMRFVFFGAGNVYAPSGRPATEDAPVYPRGPAAAYLVSKLAGEMLVEQIRETRGLHAVSLRIASPYGPGMRQGSSATTFMERAARGETLVVKDGGRHAADLIWVGDVGVVSLRALEGTAQGVFNIGSGTRTSTADLARAVVATYPETGAKIETEPPGAAPASGYPAVDITKARRVWGFSPHTLAEGLAAYRTWLAR